MRLKLLPLFLMVAALCGPQARAQATPEKYTREDASIASANVLTLSEALDAAYRLNPQLSAAKNDFGASKGWWSRRASAKSFPGRQHRRPATSDADDHGDAQHAR